MRFFLPLAALAAGSPALAAPADAIAAALEARFAAHLADPARYGERVQRQRAAFPEGDLFPYVLPVYAYANLATRRPEARAEAAQRSAALIDLARGAVEARLGEPLLSLTTYRSEATYLGNLALALACYRRMGGDGRYAALEARLGELLAAGLRKIQARPLDSWPGLVWPMDTVPALLALHLADAAGGGAPYGELVQAHLAWLKGEGTDPRHALPFSRAMPGTYAMLEGPRGCDLSLRIALLAQIDPGYAAAIYEEYASRFWVDRGLYAGFREWLPGQEGPANADSGPILGGVGLAATGLGVGAARAVGDAARYERLTAQGAQVLGALPAWRALADPGGMIPQDDAFLTGFALGDAALFWAVTWEDWGARGI